jgi:hypothetical protein
MIIYLAGYINDECLGECIEWRQKVIDHCAAYPDICILTPLSMDGNDNLKLCDEGLRSWIPSNAIPQRDRLALKKSDLIIASLDTYGSGRPPIGTICEIAWAYSDGKPVLIIASDTRYRTHPFLQYFAAASVEHVDDLLDSRYIEYFLKGLTPYVAPTLSGVHPHKLDERKLFYALH